MIAQQTCCFSKLVSDSWFYWFYGDFPILKTALLWLLCFSNELFTSNLTIRGDRCPETKHCRVVKCCVWRHTSNIQGKSRQQRVKWIHDVFIPLDKCCSLVSQPSSVEIMCLCCCHRRQSSSCFVEVFRMLPIAWHCWTSRSWTTGKVVGTTGLVSEASWNNNQIFKWSLIVIADWLWCYQFLLF